MCQCNVLSRIQASWRISCSIDGTVQYLRAVSIISPRSRWAGASSSVPTGTDA